MPNRIRELRTERNLSLEEVADKVGTSMQQISRLELGDRRLSEDWLRRIAAALGVRPADILGDAPDSREIVQDLQEAALLRFWRGISVDDKLIIAAIAHAKGHDIRGRGGNTPKKRSA